MLGLLVRGLGARWWLIIPHNASDSLLINLLHGLCQGVVIFCGQVIACRVLEPAKTQLSKSAAASIPVRQELSSGGGCSNGDMSKLQIPTQMS